MKYVTEIYEITRKEALEIIKKAQKYESETNDNYCIKILHCNRKYFKQELW